MVKLCECGCGEPAPIAKVTIKAKGHVAGQPIRFIAGHQNRGRKWSDEHREKFVAVSTGQKRSPEARKRISDGLKANGIKPSKEAAAKGNANRPTMARSPSWKGGVSFVNERKCLYLPDHPRAHKNGYVYEHIVIAERSLGRPLYLEEVVHHIDGDVANNDPSNLEVLPSQAEHIRLHRAQGDLC